MWQLRRTAFSSGGRRPSPRSHTLRSVGSCAGHLERAKDDEMEEKNRVELNLRIERERHAGEEAAVEEIAKPAAGAAPGEADDLAARIADLGTKLLGEVEAATAAKGDRMMAERARRVDDLAVRRPEHGTKFPSRSKRQSDLQAKNRL